MRGPWPTRGYCAIGKKIVSKKLVSSRVFVAYFLLSPQTQSCLSTWIFHLHLILYARVPKFLCSVTILTVGIFLIAIASSICVPLFFSSSCLHMCVSGHYCSLLYVAVVCFWALLLPVVGCCCVFLALLLPVVGCCCVFLGITVACCMLLLCVSGHYCYLL
jgi:hypothetical protein